MTLRMSEVSKGDLLPELNVPVTRADLVRYAGASGDFNPIHWNERFATEVGLPDVIAHGMLTMALAGRLVTEWTGDPGAIANYSVRFTRPVVVPDDGEGALVELSGKVAAKNDDGTVKVSITARSAGQGVLGGASAVVRLAQD
ncbi:MaoC dehydratase-like protein [Saccharopolyspora erythraea NRRL 2338]|uniref:MaoC domain protein dehydratase n=2 Tax=Saccharopolyspora erythraea TaxID=1836 RepID=A4FPR4_SACEN|nr:MaoC family dehydratase [Saccharopolyspora erythraea]EQD86923.1 MaoC family dehydratase [Saccharopolyspora erythraea D]PFG99684.1 MaoC dehydratase-like protein [Saccharopolyspora erythraea NRRL 2338]QRK89569.1 MaoC family dehydratase [Saccharopolyspora erythraea]CAM06039.1 MaoC domain protein dehydratase [Saccharopolyspora erythraea NRRL 2338]